MAQDVIQVDETNNINNQIQPSPPGKNIFSPFILIGLLFTVVFFITGSLFLYFSNKGSNEKEVIKPELPVARYDTRKKKIIAVKQFGDQTFFTFDLDTKEKKELFSVKEAILAEAEVSPDGEKFYYISWSKAPSSIFITDKDRLTKEINFAGSGFWAFSLGTLDSGNNSCFWSPDSSKLACFLSEYESETGAGTGLVKIAILDYATGNIMDVFTSDQITPPAGSLEDKKLGGWVGNNKLLFIHTKESGIEIEPADFYTVNIDTREVLKEFSYQYALSSNVAISPDGRTVFFQSSSRGSDDRFVKYNLDLHLDTILASSFVLNATDPIMSSDGEKVIYTTAIFNELPEESSDLQMEKLEGTVGMETHIYELVSGQERKVVLPEGFGLVEALLPNTKSLIINNYQGSFVFDIFAKEVVEIGGRFIGYGYF